MAHYITTRIRQGYPSLGLLGRWLSGPMPQPNGSHILKRQTGGDQNNKGLTLIDVGTGPTGRVSTRYGWSPTVWGTSTLLEFKDFQTNANPPASLNIPAKSVAAWVYPTAFNTYSAIAACRENGTPIFSFLVKSTGKLACYVQATTTINYDGTGANTLVANNWYHVAMTYDSVSGLKGYVNGRLDGSVAPNGVLNTSLVSGVTPVQQFIGNEQDALNNRWWQGAISDVAYWNRAITPEEVAFIYAIGARGVNADRASFTRLQEFQPNTASLPVIGTSGLGISGLNGIELDTSISLIKQDSITRM